MSLFFLKKIKKKEKEILTVSEQLINSGVNFFTTILLLKIFSFSILGSWVFINTFLIFSVTVNQSLTWSLFLAELSKRNNERKKYIDYVIFSTILISLIFAFSISFYFKLYDDLILIDLISVFSYVVILSLFEFLRRKFIATYKLKKLIIFGILKLVSYSLAFVIIYLNDSSLFDFIFIIDIILLLIISTELVKIHFKPSFIDLKIFFKSDWAKTKFIFSKNLLLFFSSQLYAFIIVFYLGKEDLGKLDIIRNFFAPISIIIMGLSNLFLVQLSTVKEIDYQFKILKKQIVLCFSVFIFYCLILLISKSFVENLLLGDKSIINLNLFLITFSLAAFGSSISPVLSNFFISINQNKYGLKATLNVFLINLIMLPLLVYYLDFFGAIVGVALVQILLLLFNFYYIKIIKNEVRISN